MKAQTKYEWRWNFQETHLCLGGIVQPVPDNYYGLVQVELEVHFPIEHPVDGPVIGSVIINPATPDAKRVFTRPYDELQNLEIGNMAETLKELDNLADKVLADFSESLKEV